MHFSGYLSRVLVGLTALLPISAQAINANTKDVLVSSPNRLLPRKGGSGSGRGGGGGGGRGGTGGPRGSSSNPTVKSSSSLVRTAGASSGGGGSPYRLGSNSRFPGRSVGGGSRGGIYGSSRFGSGIYSTDTSMVERVEGTDFTFGFWPIWFPDSYCGSGGYEYPSSRLNDTRPGEELVVVDIQLDPAYGKVSEEGKNHTYYMFGDKASVDIMMDILVLPTDQGGCHTIDANPANWTLSTASKDRFEPGHVLQWYRSSSFALAYTGYNNSYAYQPLNTTTPANMSDPLPSALLTSEYLSCLNKTIGDALPIMDAENTLSKGVIAAIATCSVIGLIGLITACCWCCRKINRAEKASKEVHERKYLSYRLARDREGDGASIVLPSYRASTVSKLRSPTASTFSLSPTLDHVSTPPSPVLGWRASLAVANSLEPDGGASCVSKSSFGHQYNDPLTTPMSPYFGSREKSYRMSVSSERSQDRRHSPSPCGEDRQLLDC